MLDYCQLCGKEFIPASNRQKYCCIACRDSASQERNLTDSESEAYEKWLDTESEPTGISLFGGKSTAKED